MNDFEVIEQHKKELNKMAGYQSLKGKRSGLLRGQIAEIPFVKGLSVLDVGCNAGLHSLVASKYCPSVTGIDIYDTPFEIQSYFQKHIPVFHPEIVQFVKGKVIDVKGSFEAVLAFNVLYHLDKRNLHRMTDILKGAQRILVQARVKVAKDQNSLHLPEKIVRYLEDIGFHCVVKNPKSSRPFVLGEK